MKNSIFNAIVLFAIVLGAGCQDKKESISNPEPPLEVRATVIITEADYDSSYFRRSHLDTASFNMIVREFNREYSDLRKSQLIDGVLTDVASLGENPELMRTLLERFTSDVETERVIPTYAERARYGGREAWLMEFTYSLGTGGFGHYLHYAFSIPELDTLYAVGCRVTP